METKNREKLLAIAAGAGLGLLLINWLVITPLTDSWHSRAKHIDDLRKSIAEGNALIRRQQRVQSHWDDMRTNALDSNPAVAEAQLLTAFDRWVSQSGVTEGSFRPQYQEGDDTYSTIDCRADVSGSVDNILRFLYNLEKDPLAVKLDSVELTSREDNGQQLTLALDMSGLILPAASQ